MKPSERIQQLATEIEKTTIFKGNSCIIKAILDYLDEQAAPATAPATAPAKQ